MWRDQPFESLALIESSRVGRKALNLPLSPTCAIVTNSPETLEMQTDNKLLDDLARVAASAIGTLQGVRDEVEARLRDQFERILSSMDLVTREEFDAVKAMAAAARHENDALEKRIEALEKSSAPTKRRAASGGKAKGTAAAKKRTTGSARRTST